MEYIYKYEHPKKGIIYIGRTNNLERRIKSHDTSNHDNISVKNQKVLLESNVMYFEVNSFEQSVYIEKYLIDKHKPIFNIKDKTDSICDIQMILPEWKPFMRNPFKETVPKTSGAQLKAVSKYQENKSMIKIYVEPEYKDLIHRNAESKGMTVTSYIKELVKKDISNE